MSTSPPPPGEILVITGPPGAGKTTVANNLVEGPDRGVLLDGDSFFKAIHGPGFRPGSQTPLSRMPW